MNIAGREVLRKDNYISGNAIIVLSLAPGIYVAVVSYKNQSKETKKFIVK